MNKWNVVCAVLMLCACEQSPREVEDRMPVAVQDIVWTQSAEDSWLSHHRGALAECDPGMEDVKMDFWMIGEEGLPCLFAEGIKKRDRVPHDRLERVLYNKYARQAGSDSLPDPRHFVAFKRKDSLWLSLFAALEVQHVGPGEDWKVEMRTDYPRSGKISIQVKGPEPAIWTLAFRQPGWTDNRPDPLGRYLWKSNRKLRVEVEGEYLYPNMLNGYAYLTREWSPNEVLEIEFPMSVRRLITSRGEEEVLSLEYGPVCLASEKKPKENMSLPVREFLPKNIGPNGVEQWTWTHQEDVWNFYRVPELVDSGQLWRSSVYHSE